MSATQKSVSRHNARTAFGQARAKNVGWRLDYHLATPGIAAKAKREQIFLEQRFSDHAPVIIDYDFKL